MQKKKKKTENVRIVLFLYYVKNEAVLQRKQHNMWNVFMA